MAKHYSDTRREIYVDRESAKRDRKREIRQARTRKNLETGRNN